MRPERVEMSLWSSPKEDTHAANLGEGADDWSTR